MPLSIACPQCDKTLRAPDSMAGKRSRCPNCKAVVKVPAAEPSEAPAEDVYGLSQEMPPVRPTFVAPPPVARSSEEAYAEAVSRTLGGSDAQGARRSNSRRTETIGIPTASERKSSALPYLFALTLVPLVFSMVAGGNDLAERLGRTIEEHPERLAELGDDVTRGELLSALPDGRIEGAHLAYGSWLHWVYALVSSVFFGALIVLLFEMGEARLPKLVGFGVLTATAGILLLIAFQWVAAFTQGFWVSGRSVLVILFYIIKFIGFSYQAALDPENGFLLSFLGFTFGVGLCEEFTKAAPLFFKVRNGDDLSWRAACVLGLASGVGFGVAEGIMYSANHYNGLATFGVYPVRFISCVGLHAIWTASVALMLWHNQELASGDLDWGDWVLGLLKVQGVPMILHGLYDTLLKRDMNLLALLAAIASFAWLAFLLARSRESDPEGEEAGVAVA